MIKYWLQNGSTMDHQLVTHKSCIWDRCTHGWRITDEGAFFFFYNTMDLLLNLGKAICKTESNLCSLFSSHYYPRKHLRPKSLPTMMSQQLPEQGSRQCQLSLGIPTIDFEFRISFFFFFFFLYWLLTFRLVNPFHLE